MKQLDTIGFDFQPMDNFKLRCVITLFILIYSNFQSSRIHCQDDVRGRYYLSQLCLTLKNLLFSDMYLAISGISFLWFKVVEGDMMLYDTYDNEMELGDAISSPIRLWIKNGTDVIIPYTVPNGLSDHEKAQIERAISEFNMKTCIR